MEHKHTPGPWSWAYTEPTLESPYEMELYQSRFALGEQDSILYHGANWPISEADARLMAAAPDLLAALEVAARTLAWAAQEAQGKVKREIVGGWLHHAREARAAIAKATGAAR